MPQVNLEARKNEATLIAEIVDRAYLLARDQGVIVDRLSLSMDLTAVHLNGCPLDFDALSAADDFNFAHDVFGITHNLDRNTGKLQNEFLPRFAKGDSHA